MSKYMRSMKGLIDAVDHVGKNFISINDMSNEQLLNLFELGKELELFNRSTSSMTACSPSCSSNPPRVHA